MQERMLLNKNKLLRVKGKRKEETPDSDECLKINGLRDNWDEARMLLKGKTVIALLWSKNPAICRSAERQSEILRAAQVDSAGGRAAGDESESAEQWINHQSLNHPMNRCPSGCSVRTTRRGEKSGLFLRCN
jgi:hypothetical protein